MALTLKEIQAKLLAQQANKERARSGGFGGDNAVYPFWNNPEGSTATLRFLPDGDESNDFFWLERLIIKLPFPGVKGQNDDKPVEVQVPCTDMWKANSCPITAEIRPWWKDKSLEDMARRYYRKKSYLFQGFVPSNPNKDDQEPENPIRRFIINPSVFDVIKSILMDQDLENSPTDYDHGRDFYLQKTTKGGYANYTSSKWAMKERALNDTEVEAINKHGLWNLSSFLPKKPDEDHLKAIMELFTASVNEELYDLERWGEFYRPNGMRAETTSDDESNTTVSSPKVAASTPSSTASSILNRMAKTETVAAPAQDTPPWEDKSASASTDEKPKTPDDIIAAIRRRQQQR
jgi:gp32 DNA binding protein like